jgi:hypothetical protein
MFDQGKLNEGKHSAHLSPLIYKRLICIILKLITTGITNREGRQSTVDLQIKIACFLKRGKIFSIYKGAYLSSYKEVNHAEHFL